MLRSRGSRKLRLAVLAACAVLGASVMAATAGAHATHRAHTAIVGGSSASPGMLPGIVLIADNLGGGLAAYCTGTVVAPNMVLTAAHCLEDDTGALEPASGFSVVSGTVDPSTTAGQTSGVSQVLIFPQYERAADNGDAGLLILTTPTSAAAVTLADSDAYDQSGTVAVAGWGLTHPTDRTIPANLQWANFAIQDYEYCATADNHDGLQFQYGYEFCAGDPTGYTVSVCPGDSGGPAFAQAPGGGLIEVGIVARGDDACDTTVPSIFTRVELIQPWIASEIAANPAPPPVAAAVGSPGSAGSPGGAPSGSPAVSAAPTAQRPVGPAAGRYSGTSAQRHGSVALTLGSSGVASVRLTYNLRCTRGGWRGPITHQVSLAAAPAKLVSSSGGWKFNVRFADGAGDRFSLSGRLPVLGRALGTLTVTTRNHRCASGVVAWSASLPSA
jgi:V8-like Glu-specific endopeptidase